MTTQEAIEALGLRSQSDLARALGVTRQAVVRWRRNGELPRGKAAEVRLRVMAREILEAAPDARQ